MVINFINGEFIVEHKLATNIIALNKSTHHFIGDSKADATKSRKPRIPKKTQLEGFS
jgi:hypothetical protein